MSARKQRVAERNRQERERRWGTVASTPSVPVHDDFVEPALFIARKVWIHLEKGNFEAAHAMIDEAEAELKQLLFPGPPPSLEQKLAMNVSELPLSVRTINGLEEHGVFTFEDLLRTTQEEILAIPNFKEKTLAEILSAIELMGVTDDEFCGRTEEVAAG